VPLIPSFDELAALEPRLAELLAEARSHSGSRDAGFCASTVWYGHRLMERLLALVSPDSGRQGLLGTYVAFAVAYDTLSEALPPCRGACICASCRPVAGRSQGDPARWGTFAPVAQQLLRPSPTA
jgi:hypothetical protein